MQGLYRRWMHRRERILTQKDTNRKVYPFDWGLEWLGLEANGVPPLELLQGYAREGLENSDRFFALPECEASAKWSRDSLEFQSPLPSRLERNNRVRCRLFEAGGARRAVIVLPQWNADEESHVGLCKLLQRLGITAVRHCLPFHEHRRPEGMARADWMVGPNLGRTVHAVRQAVLEARLIARLLRERGYRRVGLAGTSIGSCVGYLSFVHEPELDAAVFNFVSGWFADVVWRGDATRYVRRGLRGHIDIDDLRRCWAPISPFPYIQRLSGDSRPHLLITAKYDLTFLPKLSEEVFQEYRRHGREPETVHLPCGHYTTAKFPYSWLDGWHICRYLRRHL